MRSARRNLRERSRQGRISAQNLRKKNAHLRRRCGPSAEHRRSLHRVAAAVAALVLGALVGIIRSAPDHTSRRQSGIEIADLTESSSSQVVTIQSRHLIGDLI
jgi:hypothetical protein